MSKLKILLGRGSPRSNIEAVEHWNGTLPCDKLIPRFISEWKAYKIMRDYFLDHKEYTHLVLATDDIVVHAKHIDILLDDLELFPEYPVISGWMNVNQNDFRYANLALELPIKDRRTRAYDWMTKEQVFDMPEQDLFKVAFSGFPLMAIRRDVLDQYSFMADRVFEGKTPEMGASLDLVFCYHCQEHNIPIMVDPDIRMTHLRAKGRMRLHKADKLYFWSENGEETQIKL